MMSFDHFAFISLVSGELDPKKPSHLAFMDVKAKLWDECLQKQQRPVYLCKCFWPVSLDSLVTGLPALNEFENLGSSDIAIFKKKILYLLSLENLIYFLTA